MTTIEKGGKARKKAEPPLKVLQSEALHSLNHLYQSAVQSAIRSAIQKTSLGDSIQKTLQLQSLARKSTLRLDASVSDLICRRCHVPLLPGLTSTIRCRTFTPTSRAIKVCCRFCNSSKRQIAPPSRKENGSSLAIRNCRKSARKVEYKLARQHQVESKSISLPSRLAPSAEDVKEPAKKKKWSQRQRRRAGKVKAQSLRTGTTEGIDAIPLQAEENTSRSKTIKLPRYASRMRSHGWEASLSTSNTSSHEKEAIKMLRGDHLMTSGIGRGGFVGAVDDV